MQIYTNGKGSSLTSKRSPYNVSQPMELFVSHLQCIKIYHGTSFTYQIIIIYIACMRPTKKMEKLSRKLLEIQYG